jgi:iron complex transport system ATP-binding protein
MTSVAARDLTVELGTARVLDRACLDVGTGEWLSIVGANGAGKSTLLRAVAGLVAYAGVIELGGRPATALRRRERARLVALVPQTPLVPPGITVADYVLLGRTPHLSPFGAVARHDFAVAADVMDRLELVPFAARVVASLSGGERQRVFLARAVAQQAPVLLLDEPTTALDVGHQQQVLELVDELRRGHGLTVLSTMHDLTLAGQYADRLLLLDRGRVVADGLARDVLTEDNVAHYYGAKVRVLREGGQAFVLPFRPTEDGAT